MLSMVVAAGGVSKPVATRVTGNAVPHWVHAPSAAEDCAPQAEQIIVITASSQSVRAHFDALQKIFTSCNGDYRRKSLRKQNALAATTERATFQRAGA